MTSPAPIPMFDGGLPSLTEYCNARWAELEEHGAPPITRYRAEHMACGDEYGLQADGAIRVHGPYGDRCPGSQHLPLDEGDLPCAYLGELP